MRVLVTTTGSAGHFGPMIPFVDAARERGAELLIATRASSLATIRAAGYDAVTFADAPRDERNAVIARAHELGEDEGNLLVATEVFAGMDVRASLPGVLALCASFAPDVVLHEVGEFSAPLAAERAGLPAVCVGIGMSSSEQMVMGAVSARLREFRAELGLPARPDAATLAAARYFTLAPPALEDPDAPLAPGALRFRENDPGMPGVLPDWWNGDTAPLVYLTFGSVAPSAGYFPGLYRAAVDALADLPVRVLVTTGRGADPAELGPLPAGVHAERWVPQADVMPHASAMVCHGGFGTVRAGLAAGLPLAVLPLFADQPYNARRVAALGAGIALEGGAEAVSGLRDAVRALLADDAYAIRAHAVADEVRALPPADTAAEILRELAAR